MNNPILQVNNLSKKIDDQTIINNLSFDLKRHEILTIIGPSGAGKTTLLRILNGLTDYSCGKVILDGNTIKYQNKHVLSDLHNQIGIVFQSINLYPHLNVIDNITLSPLLKNKKNKDQIIMQAKKWLKILKIDNKEDRYPYQLSGGEKQRVAIARACMLNPKVLCFDEPTSALDPLLSNQVAEMIKTLTKQGMSILIITHDMEFARNCSNRMLTMKNGQLLDTI